MQLETSANSSTRNRLLSFLDDDLVKEILSQGLSILALLVLWQLCVQLFAIPEYIIPSPISVYHEIIASHALLLKHSLATLRTICLGFVLSVVVSIPLAICINSSRVLANLLYPLLVLTQSIPKVALAPILVIMMGASEAPRIVVTFLVAFFPLVLSTVTGLQAVPAELIELGRASNARFLTIVARIKLPYAIPFIFSGLKAAITLSVVGAVVAEFVNADAGLGYLIVTSTAFFKTSQAWAALVVLSAMGIVLFQLIAVVERLLFPWASEQK